MTWFRRLFRSEPPPVRSLRDVCRDSADAWHAGDYARCNFPSSGWLVFPTKEASVGPNEGTVSRVKDVRLVEGIQFLHFDGYGTNDYAACHFSKIRPDEHEACEPEFVALLKRTKRTVEA